MFFTPTENKDLQSWSDDRLVRHYQHSQQTMFITELYGRYVHLVYGACLKYLEDEEESRDLAMDLFEKILKKLPSSTVKSFKVWLYVLIRNECNNRIRDRRVDREKGEEWGQRQAPEADFLIQFEQLSEEEERDKERRMVKLILKKMPEKRRQCMRLFFFDGYSYKEIASKLALDIKQVKSHLQNGKRQLRQQLEQLQS